MKRVVFAVALFALGCTGGAGNRDTFVKGESSPTWATTLDGRIRVPLAAGLKWDKPTPTKDSLIKARGEPGPTFVVVAEIPDAPKPLSLATCADAHRARVHSALVTAGVLATAPMVTDETRHGQKVPRMHYALPLQAQGDNRPASTLSSWTYVLDRDTCVGIGVTTVVHAKPDDPKQPDPEDMQRLDRVFDTVADGVVVAP